jgi:signal transduction histidine kinase
MTPTSSNAGSPGAATRSGSILVVDDDTAKRYIVSRILRAAGFEIVEAEDATSALALARSNPDLLILDVKLPDGSGHDVCRELKSRPATASILVLQVSSSFATGLDRVAGLESGADAYLTHPIEPQELLATVHALLRIRRAEQERSELFAREQAARQEADRANRLKDEFLATISHELRTPLNAILGWVQLLRTGRLDTDARERALETIERNARAQSELIEDLLDMSRIISGKLNLDVKDVDLERVIGEAVDAVRLAADAKAIHLSAETDPTLGRVRGDPTRLQQVVWNLLANAIKFTPRGGRVRVRAARANGNAEIQVSDDGRGIPPEFLPHVFERFRQAESSTRRAQGGIGLGLAIVRQLVESHGGTVRAESDGTDHGATFIVSLPRDAVIASSFRAETEGTPRATPPRPLASTRSSLAGIKVLVVDDERDAREFTATVLRHAGANVAEADSAEAALRALDQMAPDAILCDIAMPGRDGFDLIAAIRELPPPRCDIPIAALTAYAKSEDRNRVLDAGFRAHLAKPLDPIDITSVVAELAHAPVTSRDGPE